MNSQHQQENIKNKLHALDLEQATFRSRDLLATFRKSLYLRPKGHCFRELSDWNDRAYLLDGNRYQQKKAKVKMIEEQYQHFSMSLSKNRSLSKEDRILSQKAKVDLAACIVKFNSDNLKSKLRHHAPYRSPEKSNTSFYEANYEPLSLLYRRKTKKQVSRQGENDQLPLLEPCKHQLEECRLPKTERFSSIMRVMRRKQHCEHLKRKSALQKYDLYQLPS